MNKEIKDLLIAHSSGKVYLTNDHNIEQITISEHANSLIDALDLLLQAERERCARIVENITVGKCGIHVIDIDAFLEFKKIITKAMRLQK